MKKSLSSQSVITNSVSFDIWHTLSLCNQVILANFLRDLSKEIYKRSLFAYLQIKKHTRSLKINEKKLLQDLSDERLQKTKGSFLEITLAHSRKGEVIQSATSHHQHKIFNAHKIDFCSANEMKTKHIDLSYI